MPPRQPPVDQPPDDTLPLAATIRRRLDETGWTLQTVAERSGLSLATVWALRDGSRGKRPQPSTLLKLAEGLQLPAEDLFELASLSRDDAAAAREMEHLRVYRRLPQKARTSVETFARALLAEHTTLAGKAAPAAEKGGAPSGEQAPASPPVPPPPTKPSAHPALRGLTGQRPMTSSAARRSV